MSCSEINRPSPPSACFNPAANNLAVSIMTMFVGKPLRTMLKAMVRDTSDVKPEIVSGPAAVSTLVTTERVACVGMSAEKPLDAGENRDQFVTPQTQRLCCGAL